MKVLLQKLSSSRESAVNCNHLIAYFESIFIFNLNLKIQDTNRSKTWIFWLVRLFSWRNNFSKKRLCPNFEIRSYQCHWMQQTSFDNSIFFKNCHIAIWQPSYSSSKILTVHKDNVCILCRVFLKNWLLGRNHFWKIIFPITVEDIKSTVPFKIPFWIRHWLKLTLFAPMNKNRNEILQIRRSKVGNCNLYFCIFANR